jgi:hypothetical protein
MTCIHNRPLSLCATCAPLAEAFYAREGRQVRPDELARLADLTDVAKLEVDDVVQLDPAADAMFGGCFLILTSVNGTRLIGHTRFASFAGATAQHTFEADQCKYVGTVAYRLEPRGAYGS